MKTMLYLTALICFSIHGMLSGQDHEMVQIGTQIWMTKNMDVDAGENHCYKNLKKNCEKFGRLYDWETALHICPKGFRLPTDEDWTRLTEEVGGLNVAGYKLMVGGKSGFNALLGGNYNGISDIFSYQFRQGYYWTSTPFSETAAWMRHFESEKTNINRSTVAKHYYFSVRCIKE